MQNFIDVVNYVVLALKCLIEAVSTYDHGEFAESEWLLLPFLVANQARYYLWMDLSRAGPFNTA